MSDQNTLLVFPCDFPIKIIGDHSPDFLDGIAVIVRHYYPETPETQIIHKVSEKGNFVSVTVTVHCLDKSTLDALYMELTQYPGIKMVL